jgi:hypothetical protein
MEITRTNTELINELPNEESNEQSSNITLFLEKKEDLLKKIKFKERVIEIYDIPSIVISIYEFVISNNQLNNKDELGLIIRHLFIHLFKDSLVIDDQVETLLNSSIKLLLLIPKIKVNKRIISFKNINCFN